VAYKLTYKLRSTEDVFAALEDNTVTLSNMKASRFFVVFESSIIQWEKKLSMVSEMIEMIQQVQKSWQYLENIFVGSEDIRKQLPQESAMFDVVNSAFTDCMAKLNASRTIIKSCTSPELLQAYYEMDSKLEKIQKSLENYLEAKRQQFPRFYFLSSDDLLEILGQAKDPKNVQSHLKKCFEGIKQLDMYPPGSEGRRQWESLAMFAPDGFVLVCLSSHCLAPVVVPSMHLPYCICICLAFFRANTMLTQTELYACHDITCT
jgi:dynein heavy chain, axonemal